MPSPTSSTTEPPGCYCILTPPGRGAVAVIGVAADMTCLRGLFVPATDLPWRVGSIRYGQWHHGEAVIVCPLALRSGDPLVRVDRFEVHCHGGSAAVARIADDLQRRGGLTISPDGRLERAGNQKTTAETSGTPSFDPRISAADPYHHENAAVLNRCRTTRTAALAIRQVRGSLHRWFQSAPGRSAASVSEEASLMLAAARWTTRLADVPTVTLVGPPNVGKSSLINALVGYERSIVLDRPGTTRDVVSADTVIDGIPLTLRDTAGQRASSDPIEREGVRRAARAASESDLVVSIDTPHHQWTLDETLDETPVKILGNRLRVFNQCDLGRGDPALYDVQTSVVTGEGIDRLAAIIVTAITGSPAIDRRPPRPGGEHSGQPADDLDHGLPALLTPRQVGDVKDVVRRLPDSRPSP